MVLLDLSLPDSWGLETFSKVYAEAPGVAIVVLTGFDVEAFVTESIQRGAQDYLLKGRLDAYSLGRSVRYAVERKRAEEAVVQASKAKSEFLANMSHELRTPLNAINGFSEVQLADEAGELDQDQRDAVEDIRTSGQHLLALINDILDLSKIEAGKMRIEAEQFNVSDVVDEVVKTTAALAATKGHTVVVGGKGGAEVFGDPLRTRQVVLNLMSNAIKFTGDGRRIKIDVLDRGEEVEVGVADSGVGIEVEDMGRLFNAFEQGRSAKGSAKEGTGLGLGLALARKLIEIHGGRLRVESEPGQGQHFHLHHS